MSKRKHVCTNDPRRYTHLASLYERSKRELPGLDPGIAHYVWVLHALGVETYESCEGGTGHAYTEPTICFHGVSSAGFIAFAMAQQHGFPVCELRRFWSVIDGELVGPRWALVLSRKSGVRP